MSRKILKAELSILEKHFPRNEGSFQIVLANPEELVCRFVDSAGNKYKLQCSISVSGGPGGEVHDGRETFLSLPFSFIVYTQQLFHYGYPSPSPLSLPSPPLTPHPSPLTPLPSLSSLHPSLSTLPLPSLQPNYPVVLPIWITECNEPFVVSLVEEMNMSDEASASASHPVSCQTCCLHTHSTDAHSV